MDSPLCTLVVVVLRGYDELLPAVEVHIASTYLVPVREVKVLSDVEGSPVGEGPGGSGEVPVYDVELVLVVVGQHYLLKIGLVVDINGCDAVTVLEVIKLFQLGFAQGLNVGPT